MTELRNNRRLISAYMVVCEQAGDRPACFLHTLAIPLCYGRLLHIESIKYLVRSRYYTQVVEPSIRFGLGFFMTTISWSALWLHRFTTEGRNFNRQLLDQVKIYINNISRWVFENLREVLVSHRYQFFLGLVFYQPTRPTPLHLNIINYEHNNRNTQRKSY